MRIEFINVNGNLKLGIDHNFEFLDKNNEGKNLIRFKNMDIFMPTLNITEGKGTLEGLCRKQGNLPCLGCGR